jgi:hypothetical protein
MPAGLLFPEHRLPQVVDVEPDALGPSAAVPAHPADDAGYRQAGEKSPNPQKEMDQQPVWWREKSRDAMGVENVGDLV